MYGLMMGGMFAGTFKVDAVSLAEILPHQGANAGSCKSVLPKSLEEFRKLPRHGRKVDDCQFSGSSLTIEAP